MRYVYGYRDRPIEGLDIEPISNGELEYILDREMGKCKSTLCFPDKELMWGPEIEISAVETMQLFNNEFFFSETLYQITAPKINREDINLAENLATGIKMEPWDLVREKFLKTMANYQTSVKLWDCQKKGGPLDQKYPDFLKAEDYLSPIRRVRLGIPDDERIVKKQIRNLLVDCNKITDTRFSKKFRMLSEKEFSKLAKAVDRILIICKNVKPSKAFNDDNIGKKYRYDNTVVYILTYFFLDCS